MNCPKCDGQLTYQPTVQKVPVPWFFGELSAWLIAGLFVGAFAALGLSNYWAAGSFGAVAGVALFLKLSKDTETDPAEGLYFCGSCKRYFRASAIDGAGGKGSAEHLTRVPAAPLVNDDAQRTLERKALRNVRALIEKIEAQDRPRPFEAVLADNLARAVLGVVGFAVVVVLAVNLISAARKEPAKPPPRTDAEYVNRVVAKIEKGANGRRRSEVQGLEGRVELELEVNATGYLGKLEVAQSSWNSRVDDQAMRLSKAAEPFGRPPPGIEAPIRMTATFRFGNLDAGNPSSLSVAGQPRPR